MSGRADLSDAERRDWLRLSRAERVGPAAFRHLIERYRTPAKALAALPKLAHRAGGGLPSIPSESEIETEIAAGQRLGATLVCTCEPAYPPLLAAVDPPPPAIWVLGDPTILARPAVAVVGARIASAAGQRFARALASELGEAGYVVVSGMARGIDGAAHEGSLASGSVAVLAGGIDDVYPPEHRGLYDRLSASGCIVSENAVGRRAQARDFPRRNRIISGLSLGVVVVEAELRSGSLITARLAGEQGREVFAVPGSPLDPRAKGTNDLIRQGAVLCEGVQDIIANLRPLAAREGEHEAFRHGALEDEDMDEAIDELRDRVEALLSPTAIPRDELARLTGAPMAAVNGALVELAVAGKAQLLPGGLAAKGG